MHALHTHASAPSMHFPRAHWQSPRRTTIARVAHQRGLTVTAPARVTFSPRPTPPWAATRTALSLLQDCPRGSALGRLCTCMWGDAAAHSPTVIYAHGRKWTPRPPPDCRSARTAHAPFLAPWCVRRGARVRVSVWALRRGAPPSQRRGGWGRATRAVYMWQHDPSPRLRLPMEGGGCARACCHWRGA